MWNHESNKGILKKTKEILDALVPPFFEPFECTRIITKGQLFAVERLDALASFGLKKSQSLLVGTMDNYSYKDYWKIGQKDF